MDKYLFIDVDGVLIPDEYNDFSDESLINLEYIVSSTDAKLILSSTWRLNNKTLNIVKDKLNKYNLQLYSTTTKDNSLQNRSYEILKWINDNCYSNIDKVKWVAIDDCELKLSVSHYIRIDPTYGLTKEDSDNVIDLLNNN